MQRTFNSTGIFLCLLITIPALFIGAIVAWIYSFILMQYLGGGTFLSWVGLGFLDQFFFLWFPSLLEGLIAGSLAMFLTGSVVKSVRYSVIAFGASVLAVALGIFSIYLKALQGNFLSANTIEIIASTIGIVIGYLLNISTIIKKRQDICLDECGASLEEIVSRTVSIPALITFIIFAGFFFYVLNAIWGAFFIQTVPQASNWCLDWSLFQSNGNTEIRCTSYLNELEERKYYHNLSMLMRNTYWTYSTFITGPFLALLIFFPLAWRRERTVEKKAEFDEVVGVGFVYVGTGFSASFVVPLLLSSILPPPVEWFPEWIVEYSESQRQQILDLFM